LVSRQVRENASDISIPGKAWTKAYDELENPRSFIPGVGIVELENPDGELANSFHERSSWSLGGRVGSEEGFSLGASFQEVEQNYGNSLLFCW
jgi:hypothetical protein